ncbi:GntR family transcriptional regulator [Gymnodinialimonas hymeniacidonis]|uniref:GntR family transcriptional regulator n=1 Tax=Gymnodinialimonas hymeniacidonis TaxID=3126508 RepID=UPI0034C6D3C6
MPKTLRATAAPVLPDAPTGALPTYLRIAEELTRDIGSGRLAAGDKLAPERAMAAEKGVAVATLRKALQLLVDRGLIERRQGSGNYVLGGNRSVGTYALLRLELAGQGGGLPTARVLDMTRAAKPATLPRIGASDIGLRIRRLRFLSDTPVAVEEIWLDARWLDRGPLTPQNISESLYRSYEDRLGLKIIEAEDVIRMGALPAWTPSELGLAQATNLPLIERRAFDQNGQAAEASWTWYDPERAQYFARVP